MSDSLSRLRVARAAWRLAAPSGLPPLVLLTDDERLPDPVAAMRALPRGSMVIVRARDGGRRKAVAFAAMKAARTRKLIVLIADDAALARACGAHGVHLPEARSGKSSYRRPSGIVTASAHSFSALRQKVDAVLLSPVFPTQSHPGRAALGAVRANLMARQAKVPVYALGGITARNAALLSVGAFDGIAAIGALEA